MSLRLLLLRHGETEYSRDGRFCGTTDPDLTEQGKKMALAFAEAYASHVWEAVYVSPMRRTIATAKPLCDASGQNMQIKDCLREINYGIWENRSQEDVTNHQEKEYIDWLTEPAWNAPTSGETAVQVASRVMPLIAEIELKHRQGNVLIVSHKATIRIILCSLLGIDLGRYRDRIAAPAASLSVLKFDRYGPMLESVGDRSYLPPELRNRQGT
jgi:broad specificity phosphatase PhoE